MAHLLEGTWRVPQTLLECEVFNLAVCMHPVGGQCGSQGRLLPCTSGTPAPPVPYRRYRWQGTIYHSVQLLGLSPTPRVSAKTLGPLSEVETPRLVGRVVRQALPVSGMPTFPNTTITIATDASM